MRLVVYRSCGDDFKKKPQLPEIRYGGDEKK